MRAVRAHRAQRGVVGDDFSVRGPDRARVGERAVVPVQRVVDHAHDLAGPGQPRAVEGGAPHEPRLHDLAQRPVPGRRVRRGLDPDDARQRRDPACRGVRGLDRQHRQPARERRPAERRPGLAPERARDRAASLRRRVDMHREQALVRERARPCARGRARPQRRVDRGGPRPRARDGARDRGRRGDPPSARPIRSHRGPPAARAPGRVIGLDRANRPRACPGPPLAPKANNTGARVSARIACRLRADRGYRAKVIVP
jgi:hypothetical protein